MKAFACELIEILPLLSGYSGYFLQGRPFTSHAPPSFARMYALARRYWCIEVQNLDVTVNHMLEGYKCVNWLTIVGESFRSKEPTAVEDAKQVAHSYYETKSAILLQADERPQLGDRNRQEGLGQYAAIARSLLPLQVSRHDSFGYPPWTDENTMSWLRRFTHPDELDVS